MAEKYAWVKLIVENWKSVSSIALLVLSLVGVGVDNYDERIRKEDAQKQVAEVARQYAAEFNPIVIQKGKSWGKYIEVKLKEHRQELH